MATCIASSHAVTCLKYVCEPFSAGVVASNLIGQKKYIGVKGRERNLLQLYWL